MRTTRKLSEQTQQSGSHALSARHRQHRDPRSATESLGISPDATLNHRVLPLHLSLSHSYLCPRAKILDISSLTEIG